MSLLTLPTFENPEVEEFIETTDALWREVKSHDINADPNEALSADEERFIDTEIERCISDFRYAAYNYFWLGQTKEAESCRFRLNSPQENQVAIMIHLWDQGRPAWIIVHKCRQIGETTLAEGLMAWKNVFFDHQISMIVAQDPEQAQHCLKTCLYMIDHLPWWMRPMQQSREFKDSLILENRDPEERLVRAGLDNWIIANGCNKISAFGQGKPIHNCHLTEISSWRPPKRAREIIEGDLKYALTTHVRNPYGKFCIAESKPRGVGGYWYDHWQVYDGEGPSATYYPFFVPAFFEESRREDPPPDWRMDDEIIAIREEFAKEWHKCDDCGRAMSMRWGEPEECVSCGGSGHSPIMLDDDQLYWYWRMKREAEKTGIEDLKLFFQEMCITPMQGFQHSAISVFPDEVMFKLQKTCRPGERGYFDDSFQWHAAQHCKICKDANGVAIDHWHNTSGKELAEEFPCQVWEQPRDGAKYVMGIDVSEGFEEGDWSVIHVIRIGRGSEIPDEQVCEWRAHIDTEELARIVYVIGMAYNTALAAIDALGSGKGTQSVLVVQYRYPEIYIWKHIDSLKHRMSNKMGIWPNYQTKGAMVSKAVRFLRRGFWTVHSPQFLAEAPFFTKDEEEAQARALRGQHDDVLMAGIYAIWGAHEDDMDAATGRFDIPQGPSVQERSKVWIVECHAGHTYESNDPVNSVCAECKRANPDPNFKPLVKCATKKVQYSGVSGASIIGAAEAARTAKEVTYVDD